MGLKERLFRNPEHWERAEGFIGDVHNLKGRYPDLDIGVYNSTDEFLEILSDTARLSRETGDESAAKDFQKKSDDLDRESALLTRVSVDIEGDHPQTINKAAVEIFRCAKRKNGTVENDSGVRDNISRISLPNSMKRVVKWEDLSLKERRISFIFK